MSYRVHEHPKLKPNRTAVDIATPVKLYMNNGTVTNFAFPCWYQEVLPPVPARIHDRHLHDHQGWPSPMHPDHSCQLWIPEPGYEIPVPHHPECMPFARHYIDHTRLHPIHLLSSEEGYTTASVAWAGEHEGVVATASIDPEEDWVVRVALTANDPNAVTEVARYLMTVFVNAPGGNGLPAKKDIVALAQLNIYPSAYQA